MNQFIYKKLPYDPVRDFQTVNLIAAVPYVLLANKDFQAKTLKDLIAMAQAQPGKVNYASFGVGGAGHVIIELLASQAGIQLTHIPYKSGALPNVPSIAEVVPGFAADGWQGMLMPAGTPVALAERFGREIAALLAPPETGERFATLGIEAWPSTPRLMESVIAADIVKWGNVIRGAKIELQ